MGDFDDMIPEFITESTELLSAVESGLLALEEGSADDSTVHTVFRAIHSIKGGASFVGLTKIERLAHKMEDLLNLIRNHDLEATQPVIDALLQSLDVLTTLFDHIEEQDDVDIDGPIRALAAALESQAGEGIKEEVASTAASASTEQEGLPKFEISDYNLKNAFRQGNVYILSIDLARQEARGMNPVSLAQELLSMGEILDTVIKLPSEADASAYETAEIVIQVLYSTVLESDLLSAALQMEESEFRLLSPSDFDLDNKTLEAKAEEQPEPAPAEPKPEKPAPAPKPKAEKAPAAEAKKEPEPEPQHLPVPSQPAAPAMLEPEEPPTRGGEYLTFTLGGELYGIDILSVQEIMGVPHMARLPRAEPYTLGVMNLRGMVVPVTDARIRLNLTQAPDPVVIVMHVGNKIMGAVVDAVQDVVQLKDSDIQDTPVFAGGLERTYMRGLGNIGNQMVILLEMGKLLMPPEE